MALDGRSLNVSDYGSLRSFGLCPSSKLQNCKIHDIPKAVFCFFSSGKTWGGGVEDKKTTFFLLFEKASSDLFQVHRDFVISWFVLSMEIHTVTHNSHLKWSCNELIVEYFLKWFSSCKSEDVAQHRNLGTTWINILPSVMEERMRRLLLSVAYFLRWWQYVARNNFQKLKYSFFTLLFQDVGRGLLWKCLYLSVEVDVVTVFVMP